MRAGASHRARTPRTFRSWAFVTSRRSTSTTPQRVRRSPRCPWSSRLSPAPRCLASAPLQYSADGGTTWRTAPLAPGSGGEYTAIFPTPKEGKTVSLKLHLADADGNTTDLTTIDAYHLR
ncbi:hypothetical protein ACIBG5_01530 [Kribbella sp. NPDC050241]|uniref:hypothetical protein n=1 Tax=Kribbella sp. NPDC050241 TaxID=3364115 RepID=UPI0037AE3ECA